MLFLNCAGNLKSGFLVGVSVLLLMACGASEKLSKEVPKELSKESPNASLEEPSPPVGKMLLIDHSLVGKIWDVAAGQFVDKQQLAKSIFKSDYLLLGETHDNVVHHQGQAWAIAQLNKQRLGAVAFEMISQQQGRVIADKKYDSTESLIAGLSNIKTNWDYTGLYQPVFAEALKAGYTILPANFDREQIMLYARKGEAELPQEIKMVLSENVLPLEQEAASRKEIEGSHCGMINDEMTAAMMLVQRAKDAEMTRALRVKKDAGVRVLVAGSGHVRSDRGVPFYLRRYAADKNILTIAWAEVEPDAVDAKSYAEHWGSQQLPFDYVWFTPRVDRPDPCEQFRKHMKNKQEKQDKEDDSES